MINYDYLTKILKPDLGIITNISYAHSKNFKNINGIAKAKSEIIDNIKPGGAIILNADDNFYKFHKQKAVQRNLKIFSFSINNKKSYSKLIKIKNVNRRFQIFIRINSQKLSFFSNNNTKSHIQNLLATLTVLSLFFNIKRIPKDIFFP